jgi:hypothetical protein
MNEFGNGEPQDWQDLPDINFELGRVERTRRAYEFNQEVERLAIHRGEYEESYSPSASRYYFDDGSTVEVGYQDLPNVTKSVVVWTKPTYEPEATAGDGQKRRATCTRSYAFEKISESDQELDELPQDLEETEKEFSIKPLSNEEIDWYAKKIETIYERDFDIAMGNIEPPEKISIHTTTEVEVKLPNSPNYRTERLETIGSEELEHVHNDIVNAAESHAGFHAEEKYSVQEHARLMEMLRGIDPTEMVPTEINYDF